MTRWFLTPVRVFLDSAEAVAVVASVLRGSAADAKGARGSVSFCLTGPGLPGEVEIEAGEDFPVSPQVKGALKSLPGVAMVEEF